MKKLLLLCMALFLVTPALAEESFPAKGWAPAPNPLASTQARTGGEIRMFIGPSPKSLNHYLEASSISSAVFGSLYESLLSMDPLTLAYTPNLAERWTISDDKKTFTFYLNKNAKWSDGKPITAHDVKWTYDAVMDEKNLTGPHKVSLGRFSSPQVIDDLTIRFTAKLVHWSNLETAGGFLILPAHVFSKMDFNKINFELPVVSGPYRVAELNEGVSIKLARRDDWWNIKSPENLHMANFSTITFIFYSERDNAFEAFKKGNLDLFPVYTARRWVKETEGDRFVNNWIVKQKVYNSHPLGFQGFAMNMRRPPFDDIRVRKAMAYLVDRKKMNATLMYNQYFFQNSYYQDLYDPPVSCPNPQYFLDKDKARKLLAEAGYKADPKTGKLMKNGKPFTFRFLSRDQSSEKFLSIFREDLLDVGVTMIIDKKDWAAWMRDMDEYNYDMTWAAWGAGLFKDPEGMWASAEANRPAGNNITGFSNKQVDELIEKQKAIFDVSVRNRICREIDAILCSEVPYVLLWNIDYVRLLYANRFGMPPWVLSKYGTEDSALSLWWHDPDADADLSLAQKENFALPAKPASVYFYKTFTGAEKAALLK
ncbi:MAG: extracellular solute-binding protein [Thermodesulfobacteriota bacterium]